MFSLKEGRKIARIIGGKNDKKYLYLKDGSKDYKKDKDDEKDFHVKDGKLQPLPNKKVVEKIYITAPSGAGKSTFAGNWIKEAKKIYKDDEVFVFSSIKEDKELDKNNPIRITLDADLVREPIEPEEIENSIVVFDDTDTIHNRFLRASLADFRDFLLEQGRHYNIKMVMTSHQFCNYKATRVILNEATAVCFFPKSGTSYHIKRFLKEYGGVEKKEIKKIMKLDSRWICLYKTYPMYIIYEGGAFLIGQNEDD